MRRLMFSAAFVCYALVAVAGFAAAQTLNALDPAATANRYEKYLGGRRITEAPDRLMFGSTRALVP